MEVKRAMEAQAAGNVYPLISIVVPVYNVEKELPGCIESLIRQTYKNKEIILVDDGSTDDSGKICDAFAGEYGFIKVIHQENGGSVRARKTGLDAAKGSYIGFADADDYVDEEMYEMLMERLLATDADFIHSGYYKEYGKSQSCMCEFEEGVVRLPEDRLGFVLENVLASGGKYETTPSLFSKIYKQSLIKKCFSVLQDSQQYGEDLICLCACCFESSKIVYLKKAFYHYVVRENSIVTKVSLYNLAREFGLYNCIIDVMERYHCKDRAMDALNKFLKAQVVYALSTLGEESVYIQRYRFPDISSLHHKTGIIYGAGKVGIDYYKQISCDQKCRILCLVDSQPERYSYDFVQVEKPLSLKNRDIDYVLIAVNSSSTAQIIKRTLIQMGIKEKSIIWEKPDLIC